MTPIELLADLQSKGISLAVSRDKLKYRGKEAALTPALLNSLKESRAELIALLSGSNAAPINPADCPRSSAKGSAKPNAVSDNLIARLQAGSHWLTDQHLAWVEGKSAASDERFSVALAAWGEMERSLRMVFGHEGCVFGPDRRCPEDAPVVCDFCAKVKR
jgi:hypothetical protein